MDAETSEIVIVPGNFDVNVLYRELLDTQGPDSEWTLSINRPKQRFRATDPAMLVAIVGAAGSALTALVTGILQVISVRGGQRITIETSSGARIDVPASLSQEEVQQLVRTISEKPSKIRLPKD
jgi:hypothetical protein